MKPNNVFLVPCTDTSFFRAWMEFLTPYHKLTTREKDVAARLLVQYYKFKDIAQDPELLTELLWSKTSRKDMLDSLKMSAQHFQLVLCRLRAAGFLKDYDINPRFLPHTIQGDSRFMLQVVFDWSSAKNPINRNAEQNK